MSIGASIVVKGDITGSEDLVVLGRVEGNIQLRAGALMLAPGSQVVGDVAVPTMVVHGRVEGSLVATDRIEVRASAVINGIVATPALVVDEGAEITGRVEMPSRPHPAVVDSEEALPVAV